MVSISLSAKDTGEPVAHGVRGRPDGWLRRPTAENHVGRWWHKALNGADRSGIGMHDLRHLYASGLIAKRV